MRARQQLHLGVALVADIIADVDEGGGREVIRTIHLRGGQH